MPTDRRQGGVNSALVGGNSYYMTWPQIHDIYDAGHEIGGHTCTTPT